MKTLAFLAVGLIVAGLVWIVYNLVTMTINLNVDNWEDEDESES